ncbi:hypothetical protein V8F06_000280 [Rhypophila decipiens]
MYVEDVHTNRILSNHDMISKEKARMPYSSAWYNITTINCRWITETERCYLVLSTWKPRIPDLTLFRQAIGTELYMYPDYVFFTDPAFSPVLPQESSRLPNAEPTTNKRSEHPKEPTRSAQPGSPCKRPYQAKKTSGSVRSFAHYTPFHAFKHINFQVTPQGNSEVSADVYLGKFLQCLPEAYIFHCRACAQQIFNMHQADDRELSTWKLFILSPVAFPIPQLSRQARVTTYQISQNLARIPVTT